MDCMDLEAQFGLLPFTSKQLLELDVTLRQWRLIRPELEKLRRGVYVIRLGPDDSTRHAQKVAATLMTKTDHFAVGASAIVLNGLPNPYFKSWDKIEPQIAGKQTRSSRGILTSKAAPVPTPWGDTTDLIQTATTITAELPLPQALMVTDAVARRLAGVAPDEHVTNAKRIELASEQCRTEVRRRLTRYSNADALRLTNPAAEAPSESFYRGHMVLEGYDDPACGVPKIDAKGTYRFIDILLDNLAIEVDGDEKLQTLQNLRDEKEREDDLRLVGLDFLRPRVEPLYANPAAAMAQLAVKIDDVRLIRKFAQIL